MNCDVGEVIERLENELTAHSPILPLHHLRHSSFYSSFVSPTSQALHLTSPGEPPVEGARDKHPA